jgi:CBS domain containing-hemolysin-like protein
MVPLTLVLLACAAIYVGTLETAFSRLMRLSLRILAERHGSTSPLGRYLDEPLLLFVPARVLLGLIAGFATLLLARWTGVHGALALLALVVCTSLFVLIFEHVIPLRIVRHDPERVLALLLPSFSVVIGPITSALLRVLVRRPERVASTAAQEQPEEGGENPPAHVEAAEAEGMIEGDGRELLRSIASFGDTLVREVMTPRPDIVAIRADSSLEQLKALFREQEYSRIPVFKDNLDNIVGVVYVKDLIQLGEDRPITAIMRPPHFVPETKRVSELLKEFQRQQIQTALVVDEYGGTAGLVTMEDLIEELVGEIRDEYDVEAEPVVDEGNGAFVFSGKVDIDDLSERLKVPIEREGFETVGGYVLSHLGRVPSAGETFELDGMAIEVLEAERRRLTRIRVRRLPAAVVALSERAAGDRPRTPSRPA